MICPASAVSNKSPYKNNCAAGSPRGARSAEAEPRREATGPGPHRPSGPLRRDHGLFRSEASEAGPPTADRHAWSGRGRGVPDSNRTTASQTTYYLFGIGARQILFALLVSLPVFASDRIQLGQAFLDLKSDGILMNVSAHPDDEDGSTLAYYRMKYGMTTHSVFFTRGEGGQNEIGFELYEELGVIRTDETSSAAQVLETEPHFLNFPDFGYSKSAAETFEKWGGEQEMLRRFVYFIRRLKPDVIFSNHNPGAGHGHHQAVAQTLMESFSAAADSSVFREQLDLPGIELWQPKKLYLRVRSGGDKIDVTNRTGEENPLRSTSYVDIATEALRKHRSQGMDKADLRRFTGGITQYKMVKASATYPPDSTSFFAGILSADSLAPRYLRAIKAGMDSLSEQMTKTELHSRLCRLLERLRADNTSEIRLRDQWREELERLLLIVQGIQLNIFPEDRVVIPGQKTRVWVKVTPRESATLQDARFSLPEGWDIQHEKLFENHGTLEFAMTVGANVQYTLPRVKTQYDPVERRMAHPVEIGLLIDGREVLLRSSLRIDIAPPLEVSIEPAIAWIPEHRADEEKEFTFHIVNHFPNKTAGRVHAQLPAGWKAESSPFVIGFEDSATVGTVLVRPPRGIRSGEYDIRFDAGDGACDVKVKVFPINLSSDLHFGLVKSYDNTIEEVSKEMGLPCLPLSSDDISDGDLSRFPTIVIDIRAYAVRPDLVEQNKRLLEYVHDGGHLVVMYQKEQDWHPEYAPYPFLVKRKRVTQEDAPVNILLPGHVLLNKPNRIAMEDWNGWIQERGVYFPDEVSLEYDQLISCCDFGEQPLSTGWLIARYGKGSYMYTSYVWYRQLKERHQGALKCFANMISYPSFR